MSLKIYDAYRIKDPSKVWEVLWKIRDQGHDNAVEALRKFYRKEIRHISPTTKLYKKRRAKDPERDELTFRLYWVKDLLNDGYKENVTSSLGGQYALDISVGLYPYQGEYYLRVFCWRGGIVGEAMDFVRKMEELEDFHYQNSTDRPKDISAAAWKHREKVWEGILEHNKDRGDNVCLDIVSWSGFYLTDPWLDLAREWHKDPMPIPSREEVWAEIFRKYAKEASFEPGRVYSTEAGAEVLQKGQSWVTTVQGKRRRFKSLDKAADYVYLQIMPEDTREWVLSWTQRMKEERKQRALARSKRT